MKKTNFLYLLLPVFLTGCAVLHHYSLGDIDNRSSSKPKPFTIMVSEKGINLNEGLALVQGGLYASNSSSNADAIKDIEYVKLMITLSTMGPRTGAMTFVKNYTDTIPDLLYKECPSGNITGLRSVRETAQYPVITGEIIKIEGYCLDSI
ncbi:hypothetical protein [Leptospira ilyithenensis]|uniref:Lipoprotein n=1 Tax=Leptospira ilyithenensis TaxID=2484901 RepID=A0A4R9LNI0_9LEPT|nr:hypothetical protein [Leptospira ilyithenensis]TGN07022.1 hypothetical protein EHS11_18020 [Leptospira ilyithenensis]